MTFQGKIESLFSGSLSVVRVQGGRIALDPRAVQPPPAAVMPGAFNPLHAGHRRMMTIATETLGAAIDAEISIWNVDKKNLSPREVERRVRQFSESERIWLTRAATFVEKAKLFPGVTFVVGADTLRRLIDPAYYAGHAAERDRGLAFLEGSGCQFLVFGRAVDGRFYELDDFELPPSLRRICRGVSQARFRMDLSSSQVRAARQQP